VIGKDALYRCVAMVRSPYMGKLEDELLLVQAREALRTGEAVQLRKRLALSQEEVALLAKISRPTVVRYEAKDREPTGVAGLRYAETLVRLGLKLRELA